MLTRRSETNQDYPRKPQESPAFGTGISPESGHPGSGQPATAVSKLRFLLPRSPAKGETPLKGVPLSIWGWLGSSLVRAAFASRVIRVSEGFI